MLLRTPTPWCRDLFDALGMQPTKFSTKRVDIEKVRPASTSSLHAKFGVDVGYTSSEDFDDLTEIVGGRFCGRMG